MKFKWFLKIVSDRCLRSKNNTLANDVGTKSPVLLACLPGGSCYCYTKCLTIAGKRLYILVPLFNTNVRWGACDFQIFRVIRALFVFSNIFSFLERQKHYCCLTFVK